MCFSSGIVSAVSGLNKIDANRNRNARRVVANAQSTALVVGGNVKMVRKNHFANMTVGTPANVGYVAAAAA